MPFGLDVSGAAPLPTLDAIVAADQAGVPAIWVTTGVGGEQLAMLSAAAARTSRIMLGTAVLTTYPRHPIMAALGTAVVEALAPGRFRLGIGPSHKPMIEDRLGLAFKKPLQNVREYVTVLRQAFTTGAVDFSGQQYDVHLPGGLPQLSVPLLVSALRTQSFALAGEIADGAIAWNCPADYLRQQALPAMQQGAQKAAREVPPLVAHCYLCPTTDVTAARTAARERLGFYSKLPFYAAMFEAAGAGGIVHGSVENDFIDALVAHGDADACQQKLRDFKAHSGATEVIVSPLMPLDTSRAEVLGACMEILAVASTG